MSYVELTHPHTTPTPVLVEVPHSGLQVPPEVESEIQSTPLAVLLMNLRRNIAKRSMIRVVIKLKPSAELLDAEGRPQERRPIGPRAPYDTARRKVTTPGMPGHGSRIDFVRSAVEIDDVTRNAGHQKRRAGLRCALVELIDVDVRVAEDGQRRRLNFGFDLRRDLQSRVRHFDQDRGRLRMRMG